MRETGRDTNRQLGKHNLTLCSVLKPPHSDKNTQTARQQTVKTSLTALRFDPRVMTACEKGRETDWSGA